MRHCRKILFLFSVIFFAFPAVSTFAATTSAKQDSSSRRAAADKQITPSSDSLLAIEDSVEKPLAPAQSKASNTRQKSSADSLALFKAPSSRDSLAQNARQMFRSLGNFHRAMGIYNISAGVLAVIAGAAILEKQDILPFSLSLVTLGGITVGIGIWEITIARTLSKQ